MIYVFGNFELDLDKVELREKGAVIAVEPQVFALIGFLIENRARVVTKEEIIERIWDGRAISDSAVASRVKSARQALGDDGAAQRLIRTIHGVGFRFVGDAAMRQASIVIAPLAEQDVGETPDIEHARPSIAVLPFGRVGADGLNSTIADALPQDLTTELSRLRWLFVIARASAFRFRSDDMDIDRIRDELKVRYCLSGSVELIDRTMIVSVELSDTHDKGVVWSDRFRVSIGAVHEIREEIVRAVINALELQIPLNEARRARLKAPSDLDAWSAYHLGLQHMYRFNKADNAIATSLFERATALAPEFARAYAGLSFTHFQDSFLRYSADPQKTAKLAESYAAQALERDPVDPFGNLTMGRSHILRGDLESCMPWLDRANALNPNYAQAKYSRAWTQSLLGDAAACQVNVDAALALSPLDPLLYGMLGVRSFSHMALGETEKAVEWAERAAHAPSAHVLIDLIASVAHGLNGDDEKAKAWAASARRRAPNLTKADFLRAFPFREPQLHNRVLHTLERYGF